MPRGIAGEQVLQFASVWWVGHDDCVCGEDVVDEVRMGVREGDLYRTRN